MQKHLEDSTVESIGRQTAEVRPTHDEIELRAYQACLARGCAPGQDVEDWLQAERQLLEEPAKITLTARAAVA